MTAPALADVAPAKINLTLRIAGRRPDGYHDLESLVSFADVGDNLRLKLCDGLSLSVDGEGASQCGATADNLVLKAARELQARTGALRSGRFQLTKHLPVAAGLGGGSSDAAAALRLLARANALDAGDPRLMAAARATGADVPVCLDPRPRVMRGVGDRLSAPLRLPQLHAVLVNAQIAVPTARIFAAWSEHRHPAPGEDALLPVVESGNALTFARLLAALKRSSNDLEAPALKLFPAIADVLAALGATTGCRLARMSGSGGACFGLFASLAEADAAAARLQADRPGWWVRAACLGSAAASQ